MRANDIFIFEDLQEKLERESFLNEMVFEGIAESKEDAVLLCESRIDKVIRDYSRRYTAGDPPEVMVFQDRANPKHHAVLAAGSNMFYRFDVVNGKIVSEERYRDFKELLAEKEVLTMGSFAPVDSRSYLQKNWKKLLMWIIGGTGAVLIGGPLIMAWLATFGAAIAFIGKFMVGAGLTVATLSGMGWISRQLSGDASNQRYNDSGR